MMSSIEMRDRLTYPNSRSSAAAAFCAFSRSNMAKVTITPAKATMSAGPNSGPASLQAAAIAKTTTNINTLIMGAH